MTQTRNLIEDLKQEHKFLVNTLNKVKETGISTKEGKDMLFSAKTVLLQHLKKEDEFLYPKLKEKAQTDQSLKEITDTFSHDITQISEQVLEFFQKYSQDSNSMDFAKDFGLITALLLKRIRREESILYEAYLRYFL